MWLKTTTLKHPNFYPKCILMITSYFSLDVPITRKSLVNYWAKSEWQFLCFMSSIQRFNTVLMYWKTFWESTSTLLFWTLAVQKPASAEKLNCFNHSFLLTRRILMKLISAMFSTFIPNLHWALVEIQF